MTAGKTGKLLLLTITVVVVQLITHYTGKAFFLTQLTMSAYYTLVIAGLCVLIGYTGQISLGHAGFFSIGGYLSAVLTTHDLTPYKESAFIKIMDGAGLLMKRSDLYGGELLHFNPWAACFIAISTAVIIAYLIGGPVLKLKGHYLAMATLGFGIIINRIVLGLAVFGEADGISDVPSFTLIQGLEVSGKSAVRIQNYYVAFGMLILGMLILSNLINSRVGRALRSIHGAEDAANAMGVNTAKYKLHTFVLSAAFAAVAGVFLTHFNGGIGPSESSVMKSVRYVAIVAVGGMANLWGALSMGVLLEFLSLRGYFGSYDDAVFGSILIVIMLFAPDGILKLEIISGIRKIFGRTQEVKQTK